MSEEEQTEMEREIENEINQEDNQLNDAEDRADINLDLADSYGAPDPSEKINQYTITKEAIKSKDPVRTTFLHKEELGKPLFSVRFYLSMQSIAETYNSELISNYFKNHVNNIASSGMSNEGFIMKLNVTNNRNVTRRHERKIQGIKQGEEL